MTKRLITLFTLATLIGIIAVWLNPVNNTFLKLQFLGCLLGFIVGLMILFWRQKILRVALFVALGILLLPWALPGRKIEGERLRQDYVQRVVAFEGTDYFWGGENSRGIDCSGLPRRALRDALFAYGIKTANGRAFRACLEQWWFDTSAKALGEGYRNFTTPVGTQGTIKTMAYDDLVPGDLAVTRYGVHVLVYLGNNQWIQAEPSIDSVIILDGRKDHNPWFGSNVSTYRWRWFTE